MYSVSSLCVCVYTHTFLVLWGKGFPSNYNDIERQYIKHNYIKEMFFVFELVSFFNFFPLTCELEENEIYRLFPICPLPSWKLLYLDHITLHVWICVPIRQYSSQRFYTQNTFNFIYPGYIK